MKGLTPDQGSADFILYAKSERGEVHLPSLPPALDPPGTDPQQTLFFSRFSARNAINAYAECPWGVLGGGSPRSFWIPPGPEMAVFLIFVNFVNFHEENGPSGFILAYFLEENGFRALF